MAKKPIDTFQYDGENRKTTSPGLLDIPVKHPSSLTTGRKEPSPMSFPKSSKPLRGGNGGDTC